MTDEHAIVEQILGTWNSEPGAGRRRAARV